VKVVTRYVLSIALVTLLLPSMAAAQDPPPPRHEQTFEAAYVGVTGNASSSTFGLGADLISRPDTWVMRNKLAFVRNESNDVLVANAFDWTSRAQKALNERVSAFGEYGFFRDRFAGVVRRNAVTGGVALKVADSARQTLGVDLGAGYVNEARLAGDDISSASYVAGAGYKLRLSETAELGDDVRLSGLFEESSNWRLDHTIAVTTRVAAGLSLKVSHGVRYANLPPPGFKKTDAILSVALVAKFAQP
jgi:putative salt-induced outer membrane protein YdiY